MNASLPSSIRILLAEGSPAGIWIVDHAGWSGQGVVFSRSEWATAKDHEEIDRAGVYVLIGPDEEDASVDRIYIGETDSLLKRLPQHIKNKSFWERVVFFCSRDETINKGHLHHLESRLIDLAGSADRARLDNSTVGQATNLSKADRADAERFLAEVLTLMPILRVDAFNVPETVRSPEGILHVSGPEAKASGFLTSSGFVVEAGSIAREQHVPSIQAGFLQLRNRLVTEGVLTQAGFGKLQFEKDYVFSAPSTAAAVVLGRNANGRAEWVNKDGKSLAALEEEAS